MAGQIVHVEFPSESADRAQRFWNGLFGWSFESSGMPDMDYRMAQTTPETGAAIYEAPDRDGHGRYYFATDDIEASVARVRELGGEAEGKMPVPGHGWFAACKDSEGNAFYLWQADASAA